MSYKTNINWTDSTWPVVAGCTKVSAGCDHCYAIRDSRRLGGNPNPKVSAAYGRTTAMKNGRLNWAGLVRCLPERLDWPLKWKKPRRIFVCNESDLFHEAVPDEFVDQIFAVMAMSPQHSFQCLTKRTERMRKYCSDAETLFRVIRAITQVRNIATGKQWAIESVIHWPLPNCWVGVSVEDQKTANERIPLLLQTSAAVRFVSYEPALGPENFRSWTEYYTRGTEHAVKEWRSGDLNDWRRIDQIIAGGESGPGARPSHPDWFRSVRDQCQAAGVPFFFKQHGEWLHESQVGIYDSDSWRTNRAQKYQWADGTVSFRIGKKATGRLLDGRTWNESPEAKT